MKPFEFYILVIIAAINLVIGFVSKNLWISLVGFGIALYLKPHVKHIPIAKGYRRILKVEDDTTVEDLVDAKRENEKKKK